MKTVQFEEEDAHEEAGAFVAVDEGVIADDTGNVRDSHLYDVWIVAVGVKLLRASEGGLKQALIAQTRSATVQSEEAVMER